MRISIEVSQGGVAVQNAEVSFNSPKGERVLLNEIAPGAYSAKHTLEWDDPSGVWCISAEAKKTTENKAGGSWIPIKIEPATLEVNLLSPTRRTFNVEDSVEPETKMKKTKKGKVNLKQPILGREDRLFEQSIIYATSDEGIANHNHRLKRCMNGFCTTRGRLR